MSLSSTTRTSRKIATGLIAGVAVLALAGCTSNSSDDSGDDTSGGSSAAAAGSNDESGDKVVIGFSAPAADREKAFSEAGRLGNYRVCRRDFRVVSVSPLPPADGVWAPESLCAPGDVRGASRP